MFARIVPFPLLSICADSVHCAGKHGGSMSTCFLDSETASRACELFFQGQNLLAARVVDCRFWCRAERQRSGTRMGFFLRG